MEEKFAVKITELSFKYYTKSEIIDVYQKMTFYFYEFGMKSAHKGIDRQSSLDNIIQSYKLKFKNYYYIVMSFSDEIKSIFFLCYLNGYSDGTFCVSNRIQFKF